LMTSAVCLSVRFSLAARASIRSDLFMMGAPVKYVIILIYCE
jgi:hypothetical protein